MMISCNMQMGLVPPGGESSHNPPLPGGRADIQMGPTGARRWLCGDHPQQIKCGFLASAWTS